MAKHTINLAADSAGTKVCTIHRKRDHWCWYALLLAQGTWGGTLSWHYSIDGGVTLIPILDLTGVAITQDANAGVNVQFGASAHLADNPDIYVTLVGSVSPDITVAVFDNN